MRRMNRKVNKTQNVMILYIVFWLILMVSIFCMPFASSKGKNTQILLILNGILFWISLVAILVIGICIQKQWKIYVIDEQFHSSYKNLGVFVFFKNRYAKIADIVMALAAIVAIIFSVVVSQLEMFFFSVGIFAFAFGMHCLLNGRWYEYIYNK